MGLFALCLMLAGCHNEARVEGERGRSAPLVGSPADELVNQLNHMRSDPAEFAGWLEARRIYYSGRLLRMPGQIAIQTQEGVTALDEAVAALRETKPMPPLDVSDALRNSAADHARDIGPKGLVAHEGSDGSSPQDRILRYSKQFRSTAEVISFGPSDPASVIADLLVDDGVANRGHRRILLDPQYKVAASACAPHTTYRTVCVIDLAR